MLTFGRTRVRWRHRMGRLGAGPEGERESFRLGHIYVGHSTTKSIVAVGHVLGRHADPACFRSFPYRDKTGQTNARMTQARQSPRIRALQVLGCGDQVHIDEEITCLRLLQEGSCSRFTPAARREICPKHVASSNRFVSRLMAGRGLVARQEFKIAYNGETRHAIRQALEQLVEYDFDPFRLPHDRWLVVLDCPPSQEDLVFIKSLYSKLHLPVFIGWKQRDEFLFDDQPGLVHADV